MFRSTKKRKKSTTILRLRDDDDDDNDEDNNNNINFEKKKTKSPKSRHKNNNDDDDKNDKQDQEEEEESDGGPRVVINKSKKNKKEKKKEKKHDKKKKKDKKRNKKDSTRPVIRSFGEDDDADNDDSGNDNESSGRRRILQKGKSGMGFGGGTMIMDDDDDDDDKFVNHSEYRREEDNNNDTMEVDEINASSSSGMYGKEALKKLKLAQKYKPVEEETTSNSNKKKDNHDHDSNLQQEEKDQVGKKQGETPSVSSSSQKPSLEDDFIPLGGSKTKTSGTTTILSGDDVWKYQDDDDDPEERETRKETKQQDAYLDASEEQPIRLLDDEKDHDEEDVSSAWEQQIARRAGLMKTNNNNTSTITNNNNNAPSNIQQTSSSRQKRQYQHHDHDKENHNHKNTMLPKLRNQIHSTMVELQRQKQDLDRIHQHRQVEINHTQEEYDRQSKELDTFGKTVEYYQSLRETLTNTIGALREVHQRIEPIQQAWISWQSSVSNTQAWQDWENDTCSILIQHQVPITQVLGRQPPDLYNTTISVSTVVDEFGRDVVSQQTMERDKRIQNHKRIRNQQQRKECYYEEDSDAFLSEDEYEDLYSTRRIALHKALQVSIEELDEEYLDLSNLVDVFDEWLQKYPEDYHQCYANLSLADLISVLLQMEHCKLAAAAATRPSNQTSSTNNAENNEPDSLTLLSPSSFWFKLKDETDNGDTNDTDNSTLTMNNKNLVSSFSWVHHLEKIVLKCNDNDNASNKTSENNNNSRQIIIERVIEKVYLPILMKLLKFKNSTTGAIDEDKDKKTKDNNLYYCYNLHSSKQGKVLSVLFMGIGEQLVSNNNSSSSSNELYQKIKNHLIQYMKSYLDNISIMIIKFPLENQKYHNGTVQDAIHNATLGQLLRICKIIVNILQYWTITTSNDKLYYFNDDDTFRKMMLDFISNKFLYLLSAYNHYKEEETTTRVELPTPGSIFSKVCTVLQSNTSWLQDPKLMMHAAPIRAAAVAYGL